MTLSGRYWLSILYKNHQTSKRKTLLQENRLILLNILMWMVSPAAFQSIKLKSKFNVHKHKHCQKNFRSQHILPYIIFGQIVEFIYSVYVSEGKMCCRNSYISIFLSFFYWLRQSLFESGQTGKQEMTEGEDMRPRTSGWDLNL